MNSTAALQDLLKRRIAILDGAMGTMIQRHKLTEADYRGDRFAGHAKDVKGNNDLLVLTQPQIIAGIHRQYLDAGADILETNTFNANTVSQADYGLESLCYELNYEGARLARSVADEVTAQWPSKPRLVAGSMGPTNRTLSISPDVNNPAFRNITFDEMKAAYVDQVRGLIDGGVDLLLLETIIDALNTKAAIVAIQEVQEEKGVTLPLMISFTITDKSGRTLSGQTVDAFYLAMEHAWPWSIGINCALGARDMRPYLAELSRIATFVLFLGEMGLQVGALTPAFAALSVAIAIAFVALTTAFAALAAMSGAASAIWCTPVFVSPSQSGCSGSNSASEEMSMPRPRASAMTRSTQTALRIIERSRALSRNARWRPKVRQESSERRMCSALGSFFSH